MMRGRGYIAQWQSVCRACTRSINKINKPKYLPFKKIFLKKSHDAFSNSLVKIKQERRLYVLEPH